MIRFTKNRSGVDCAPVAVVNALKWSGVNISYKQSYPYFQNLFQLNINKGVPEPVFTEFIKTFNTPFRVVKVKRNITITDIKRFIKEDQAMLLGLAFNFSSHIGLITEASKTHFTLVNFFGKTTQKYPINKFRKYLNKYSVGYIIRK